MKIFVETLAGQTITLEVDGSDTIENVKAQLQDHVHLLPEMMYMVFEDQELENKCLIRSFRGMKSGAVLKVIGVQPGSVPMDATRARLLAQYMDNSASAKDDSFKQAKARHESYEVKQRLQLEREEALQLATDCGKRFASAPPDVQRAMRDRLLVAGYIEASQTAIELGVALGQRDYLIQRQLGFTRKNGGLVSGFLDELHSLGMVVGSAESSATSVAITIVEGAELARQLVEPSLAVSADVAKTLRDERDIEKGRYQAKREECDVLNFDVRALKVELHALQNQMRREESKCDLRVRDMQAKLDSIALENAHHRSRASAHAPSYKLVREMFDRTDRDGSGTACPAAPHN
jgi:hypothetical protein